MKGKTLLVLFALPFFAIGVWMLWSISAMFLDVWQTNSWVQTEAYLTRGGYESHSGSDATTFEAFAAYNYEVDGRQYQGNRVTLSSGSDNIGSYQQDIGNDLRLAASSDDSIQIFVDPQNPSNSVYIRDVRWGLTAFKSIVMLVFGGVGLGLLIAVWRMPEEKDATLPEYQRAPWLLNDDWQTGVGHSEHTGMDIFWCSTRLT